MAFVGGISVAARWGITVKSAVALEQATEVNAAILDKTGTLTEGRPTVSAFECMNQADWPHGWTRSTLLHSADQLEEFVTHPLGQVRFSSAAISRATCLACHRKLRTFWRHRQFGTTLVPAPNTPTEAMTSSRM